MVSISTNLKLYSLSAEKDNFEKLLSLQRDGDPFNRKSRWTDVASGVAPRRRCRFWYRAISPQDMARDTRRECTRRSSKSHWRPWRQKEGNRFISELIFLTVHRREEEEAGINLPSQARKLLYILMFTQWLGKLYIPNSLWIIFLPTSGSWPIVFIQF